MVFYWREDVFFRRENHQSFRHGLHAKVRYGRFFLVSLPEVELQNPGHIAYFISFLSGCFLHDFIRQFPVENGLYKGLADIDFSVFPERSDIFGQRDSFISGHHAGCAMQLVRIYGKVHGVSKFFR